MTMQTTITGVEETQHKLRDVLLPTDGISKRAAAKAEDAARRAAKPHSEDRGTIANAIKTNLAPAGLPLGAVVVATNAISRKVEEGRPAGKAPPMKALKAWAKKHGWTGNLRNLQAHIRTHGTKGLFFMREGAEAAEKELPQILGFTAGEIERNWVRN